MVVGRPFQRTYDRDEALRLWTESQLAPSEIARRMGVQTRTIQRLLAPHRNIEPYRQMSPEDLTKAEAMLKERVGYREVAATLGFDQKTIAEHFPGMGLTRKESGERAKMVMGLRNL